MRVQSAFAYVVITLYDRLFQVVRLAAGLVTLWFYTDTRPTTPSAPHRAIESSAHRFIERPRFAWFFKSPDAPIPRWQNEERWVWAVPRSLAATSGITVVFFSSRY